MAAALNTLKKLFGYVNNLIQPELQYMSFDELLIQKNLRKLLL